MSDVWAWQVSHASDWIGTGVAPLVGAGVALVALVALVAVLAVRGARRRTRARRAAPADAGPSAGAAPEAATEPPEGPLQASGDPGVPGAIAVPPAQAHSPMAGADATPRPVTPSGPEGRTRWRTPRGPSSGPRTPARDEEPAAMLPTSAVALAERPSGPLAAAESAGARGTAEIHGVAAAPGVEPETEADARAEAEYQQGLLLLAQTEGNRAGALREALACFRRALEVWTRERAPERWAAVHNDIGRVYQELPEGSRASNLRTAIMYHQMALEVFDPVRQPTNWAWTQAALGAAYQSLPDGSPLANARAAVAYHQRALDVFTRENAPLAWAWNQNNLGAAYETMRGAAPGERVAHLRDAARAYAAALEVFTPDEHPAQHRLVARNLARVEAELRALE